jgi:hypothetical protein
MKKYTQINLEALAMIAKPIPSLCIGEYEQLTDDEIKELNDSIEAAELHTRYIREMLSKAEHRFLGVEKK